MLYHLWDRAYPGLLRKPSQKFDVRLKKFKIHVFVWGRFQSLLSQFLAANKMSSGCEAVLLSGNAETEKSSSFPSEICSDPPLLIFTISDSKSGCKKTSAFATRRCSVEGLNTIMASNSGQTSANSMASERSDFVTELKPFSFVNIFSIFLCLTVECMSESIYEIINFEKNIEVAGILSTCHEQNHNVPHCSLSELNLRIPLKRHLCLYSSVF